MTPNLFQKAQRQRVKLKLAITGPAGSGKTTAALKLGQARGAVLCAGLKAGGQVHEYSPKSVKLAVVGSGGAEKFQVQHMVRILLSLDTEPAEDEADALALALCHAHSMGIPARRRAAASWRDFRP